MNFLLLNTSVGSLIPVAHLLAEAAVCTVQSELEQHGGKECVKFM